MEAMDDLSLYGPELLGTSQEVDTQDISSLSETQDKVLSIAPIVSCILSVWGSSIIICKVVCCNKTTPYRRILLGLSICDVISSIIFALQPFLLPAETSQRVWAIGNDKSCSAMGFFQQLSFTNFWYNSMLSFYFLLTVKYGVRENEVARKYEPVMHVISIGWPLITASVGAGFGVYDELNVGHGCWITNYPKGCGCKEGQEGECCKSPLIAWVVAGIPIIVCFGSILVNNLLVYLHVRHTIQKSRGYERRYSEAAFRSSHVSRKSSQMRKSTRPHVGSSEEEQEEDDGEIDAASSKSSILTLTKSIARHLSRRMSQTDPDTQTKRIQAVATQAFLYVAAFFATQAPATLVRILDSLNVIHAADEAKLFPLLLFQMTVYPLCGFLNMFIYLRPSYMKNREEYPRESRLWAFRRAVRGEKMKPTVLVEPGTG